MIYIIDDKYVKDNFPSFSSYNSNDILSVIAIEQKTTLVDVISFQTYQTLLLKIKEQKINGEWTEFLDLCQFFLLFSTIRGIYDFYEKSKDGRERDFNVSGLFGKIEFAKRNIKTFLASSTITTGEEYSSDYMNGSPIYYPR